MALLHNKQRRAKEIYDKFDEIKLGESRYSIMERDITLKSDELEEIS